MVDGSYIPILGSVFIPVTKECYSAYHGSGDWYETKTNMKEINISKKYQDPLRVICSNSHASRGTSEFITKLNQQTEIEQTRIGSSLKFLYVAAGKADIYPRYHNKIYQHNPQINLH